MLTSMLDFGLDPAAFSRVDKFIISIAKYFSLTENDLNDADFRARLEIATAIHNESTEPVDFTSIVNYERLHAVIKKAAEANNIDYKDLTFELDPKLTNVYITYKNKPLNLNPEGEFTP